MADASGRTVALYSEDEEPIGQIAAEPFGLGRDSLALRLQELRNRIAEALIRDEMRAGRDHRLVAARDLVLALRSSLHRGKPVLDRPFDRPVIAKLEVEERNLVGRSPIAAVEGVRPNEIEGAGDRQSIATGEEQQDPIAHAFTDQVEELASQIWMAPLPRAGVLVETPHRVPIGTANLARREGFGSPVPRRAAARSLRNVFRLRLLSAQRKSSKEP